VLEDLGLEEGREIPHMSERFQLPEAHLQMCIPSLEFPRTDMPPNVRFIGGVPSSDVDVWTGMPEWWSEVEQNERKRDVITVTQGTMDIRHMLLQSLSPEYLNVKPCRISITRLSTASLSSIVVITKNTCCYVEILNSLDLRLK
jgi:hypothetical protein